VTGAITSKFSITPNPHALDNFEVMAPVTEFLRYDVFGMSGNSLDSFQLPLPLPCPICRSTDGSNVLCPAVLDGVERIYNLAECTACQTRFLNPLPTAEELNQFYAPSYYGLDWYKHEGRGREFGRVMLPRGSTGKFLDVGCSLGFFLDGIRQSSGWQVYGVEISPEAAAFAREKLGLDVRCGKPELLDYPDTFFDYLHVNNVLEHVKDPSGFLKECRRVLRKGGQCYLSVPNGPVESAGLLNYFQIEKQPVRARNGHLFFFSPTALQLLFQETDFKIVSSHTYGLRRGLRALGYLPQKSGWKKHYRPHTVLPDRASIQLPARKKRLPGYYAYRFWHQRLKMLPGLWNFGLDFEIILRAD
jgi:SAM-dependent methyltransferase